MVVVQLKFMNEAVFFFNHNCNLKLLRSVLCGLLIVWYGASCQEFEYRIID